MHDAARVVGRNFDCRVHLGGRGATHEQGNLHSLSLHGLGHVHHLVQRGGDEAREAADVSLVVDEGVDDFILRAHHADVDHLEVIAAEHDSDDVLADVVDVTLDGGDKEHACVGGLARAAVSQALLLHKRDEVAHGLLHHARRLDHLRQKHLTRTEEVADDVHAIHEGALDDLQRAGVRAAHAALLGVSHAELVNALDERVLQALAHSLVAPCFGVNLGRPASTTSRAFLEEGTWLGLGVDGRRELEHALRGVAAAVQQHILDVPKELLIDFLVHVLNHLR
mmetsp:Transcript_36938/g.59359  ORF Transcript_36938/g.59359 Transcript_36938/m.59359 type:complete len:281 (-) Transcript_36938:1252-2094(-)